MESVNFTRLTFTPTSVKKKLNCTYSKPQTRNSFSLKTYQQQGEKIESSCNILKSIGLTESAWELYQVNALFDYSYQRIKLYEYQKLLAQNIKQAILESDDEEYNSVEFGIQLKKISETAFTEKDSPALKITVGASEISDDGFANEYEEVFCGFLISVERKEGFNEEERLRQEATILPLLLVRYDNKIFLKGFIDFLEGNFSCLVSPLRFTSMDLKWIMTLFSSPGGKEMTCATVLQYKVPIEELKAIDYTVDTKSVHKVWSETIEENKEIITEDDVNEFFSVLESHFYDIFRIDLSQLELCAVRTPLGIIKRDDSASTFEAYDSSKLYFVMRYLTHIAQEVTD